MVLEVMMAVFIPAYERTMVEVLHLPDGFVVARASLGIPDTLFIFVVALVVFGPKRLPEIGRQLGKLMFEFRRASNDFKLQIEEELRLSEQQEKQKVLEMQAAAAAATAPAVIAAGSLPAATVAPETPAPEGALVLQPPSSGSPVEAQRPNRSTLMTGNSPLPSGGSPPEWREAIARGTATTDEVAAGTDEVLPAAPESAPAHHG